MTEIVYKQGQSSPGSGQEMMFGVVSYQTNQLRNRPQVSLIS